MKKKQNVSISQVRKHLEVKGIDEQDFFALDNEENKELRSEVFYAFTDLIITNDGVLRDYEDKDGNKLTKKHEFDVERFYQIQNIQQFVELMNDFIDMHNEVYQKKALALEIFNTMSEEDNMIQNRITARALGHLESINTVRKERELNIADIRREHLESFSDFNTMIKAFSIRAEKRFQELQELDNQDPNQELER